MTPRSRPAPPPREEWRPGPPGEILDTGHVRCGVCQRAHPLETTPAELDTLPARERYRLARSAGFRCTDSWGWVHDRCEARARRQVKAGHVQLPLELEAGP